MTEFPRKLHRDDSLEHFSCGVPELDRWLQKFAYANLRSNNAVTYVIADGGHVIGFYALAMAAVERDEAPAGLNGRERPSQVPCILIARLAVDEGFRGRGYGFGLLRDALERAATLSEAVGAAAVLVHARDETAKAFYLSQGNFLESPVEPLHLFAPMKEIRRIFLG